MSLQSNEQAYYLPSTIMIIVYLPLKQRIGTCTAHPERFKFPKLRDPLLYGMPLCAQESSVPVHIALWQRGFGNWYKC